MSTPLPTRALPAVPNLEQQKGQARELLAAARARDAEALERFGTHHPRLAARSEAEARQAPLSLHDAQLVIAREYGFASWPKLKAHIEAVASMSRTRIIVRDVAYYDDRARGLLAVLPDGARDVLEQVRTWHPGYAGAPDDVLRSTPFTLEDARLVYARQHGFASWARFVAHLERLDERATDEPFLAVFEAGRRGDWPRVMALLRAHPELLRVRGTNGNTLLNLASSLAACPPDAKGTPDASASGDNGAPGQHR